MLIQRVRQGGAFLLTFFIAVLMALPISTRAQEVTFSNEQLDQWLAPIALYPDALLSQVLMAATYPADVSEAVKWSKANPNQKGDAAVKAVEKKDWDPSVASLVAVPQVLAMMGEKPDWVRSLGDAFLAKPEAVMDSVQRLRAAAYKAGNLKTSEQQIIVVEQAAPTTTVIKIEPASPQVIYVPAYNPTVVYGVWAYPSYPPYYWPTPGYVYGNALVAGIAFGTGIAITNAIWGGFDWGRQDVNINVNHYNNINVNKRIDVNQTNMKWEHNSQNRKGVPYSDAKSREKFDNKPGANRGGRDAGRGDTNRNTNRDAGRDASRDADRERARAAMAQKTERSEINRNATNSIGQQRNNADHALKGTVNPSETQRHVDRGNASRATAQTQTAASPRPAAHRETRSAPAARPAGAGGRARH